MANTGRTVGEAKFYSIYPGEEIDEALTHVKKNMKYHPDKIDDSTVDAKLDINTLTDNGNHYVMHYTNSYDDTLSGKQICVTVINFDDHIRQSYVCEGEVVKRVYDRANDTWSEWKKDSSYIIAEAGEEVHPTKPTIIFQKVQTN